MLRMLRSRISRRVITEQHIALTQQFRDQQQRTAKGKEREVEEETRVGLVDTKLNAADVVRKCGRLLKLRKGPEGTVPIVIEGDLDVSFAYIAEHIEYATSLLFCSRTYRLVTKPLSSVDSCCSS